MLSPKLIHVVIATTAAFGLSACETVTVRTDSAHDITAEGCHTYAFATEHVAGVDQPKRPTAIPRMRERLKVSIQTNMAARGYPTRRSSPGWTDVAGYAKGLTSGIRWLLRWLLRGRLGLRLLRPGLALWRLRRGLRRSLGFQPKHASRWICSTRQTH